MDIDKSMAVEIAKDVILQLRRKKLYSHRGNYIQVYENFDHHFEPTDDFRVVFNEGKIKYCNVCALGALLVGYVSINDKMSVRAVRASSSSYSIGIVLQDIFSAEQVELIERVFECWGLDDSRASMEDGIFSFKVIFFNRKYPNDKDRLVAIMRSIIRNKGEFKFSRKIERTARKFHKQLQLA